MSIVMYMMALPVSSFRYVLFPSLIPSSVLSGFDLKSFFTFLLLNLVLTFYQESFLFVFIYSLSLSYLTVYFMILFWMF